MKSVYMLSTICALPVCLLVLAAPVVSENMLKEGIPPFTKADSSRDGTSIAELPHFTDLARALSPAVVNISVETGSSNEDDSAEGDGEAPEIPFFKRDPGVSLGSGFIIQEDGYIVTNYHVIRDAKRIKIRLLDDKNEYLAKVIGQDPMTDVALIKIKPTGKLATVYLGDSDQVEVGEWVLAIGNQFQLGQTVTAGIVSAKSRRVSSSISRPYDQFLQTDAPINPGSSGGPLFNTKGQVIGINTAIFSPGRGGQMGGVGFNVGIGFAIPVNLAKGVLTQLRSSGKVTRGLLGVLIQEIDPDLSSALGLSSTDGALVSEVKKGSPAEEAGFKRGDIIFSFNGSPVKDHNDLPLMVANTDIGSVASVEALRNGKVVVLKPKVGEMKDVPGAAQPRDKVKPNEAGLVLKDLTPELAATLEIADASGVLIESVENGSIADRSRLTKGDIIEEFAGTAVPDVATFEKVLKSVPRDKPASLLIRRKDGVFFTAMRWEK